MIIREKSTFKKSWDIIIGFCVLSCAIVIPFSSALHLDKLSQFKSPLWTFELIITCFFLLDIFICFKTSYLQKFDHIEIIDQKKIAKNYMYSWEFVVDAISAFPFFLFDIATSNFLIKLLVLSRLFRILKLFKQWKKISNSIGTIYAQLFSILFWFPIVLHILSCGWLWVNNTVYDDNILLNYAKAVYMTMGHSDNISENTNIVILTYAMIVQITSAVFYGFSIASISNLLAKKDAGKICHLEKMDRINSFVNYRRIPESLQTRIYNYFDYIWLTQRGHDENGILNELPKNIKIDVALYLKRELLDKVDIFKNAPNSLKRELALNMQSVVYLPSELIISYGDIGEEMYFISKGQVSVLSADMTQTYATICEGGFFGEIALLEETVRTANVQAIEYCDLYILNKKTFDQTIERYPDFGDAVKNIANQRNELK